MKPQPIRRVGDGDVVFDIDDKIDGIIDVDLGLPWRMH
jgi:hypothetical protein